jgi:cytoskeleton protein RodZ
MKETGQRLKSLREEKGVSLEEVVLATKIKLSSLRAIEEGDQSKLPSKTFIRGFVQSYAKYLEADEDEIMELFQNEMGSTIDMPRKNENFKEADSTDQAAMKFANSSRHPLIKVFVGVGAVVLLTLIYFVSSTIDKYQEEKQLVKPTQEEAQNIVPLETESTQATEDSNEENNQEADTSAPIDEAVAEKEEGAESDKKEDVAPVAETKQETKPVEKAEEVAKKPEPVKEEPKIAEKKTEIVKEVKVEEKKPEIKKPEEKKAEEVVETKKVEEKKEDDTEKVTPKKVSASFVPQEIIIEALDEVELEFKTDTGSWVEITLKPEQIHTIKGRNTIALKLSNGGAVNIIHNGKDRGVPGTLGSEIELKYPQ